MRRGDKSWIVTEGKKGLEFKGYNEKRQGKEQEGGDGVKCVQTGSF